MFKKKSNYFLIYSFKIVAESSKQPLFPELIHVENKFYGLKLSNFNLNEIEIDCDNVEKLTSISSTYLILNYSSDNNLQLFKTFSKLIPKFNLSNKIPLIDKKDYLQELSQNEMYSNVFYLDFTVTTKPRFQEWDIVKIETKKNSTRYFLVVSILKESKKYNITVLEIDYEFSNRFDKKIIFCDKNKNSRWINNFFFSRNLLKKGVVVNHLNFDINTNNIYFDSMSN